MAVSLFAPYRLGALALPNRILMAPMTRNRAGDGGVAVALNAECGATAAAGAPRRGWRMLTSRTTRLALLALLGTVLAAATITASASAATQRYASPSGAGTACTSASPCSITQAVSGAGSGDEVIVTPGDYPLTATLSNPAKITIHGVAGQPRPRLLFSGGWLELHSATLRYVEVDQALAEKALFADYGSMVEQVIAKTSAPDDVTANIESSTIRDSLVVASGSNGIAIKTEAYGASNTSTYRNVTAIARASGGVAIEALARGAAGNVTIHATNVIALPGTGGAGLKARTDNSGAHATITYTHTNFQVALTFASNTAIVDGGGNQVSAPAFVDEAGGDYRQANGSPTIGAGLDDPANGAFDVDGDPRKIGTTDIGADEFVLAPTASTGLASAVSDHAATLGGSVNANGAPTSYHFQYGPTSAYGATTPATAAGSGTGAVPAGASLDGLSPATAYHYRLVATNAGGVTHGADHTFDTAASAPPTTPPPTTQPPAAFAGVKL